MEEKEAQGHQTQPTSQRPGLITVQPLDPAPRREPNHRDANKLQ